MGDNSPQPNPFIETPQGQKVQEMLSSLQETIQKLNRNSELQQDKTKKEVEALTSKYDTLFAMFSDDNGSPNNANKQNNTRRTNSKQINDNQRDYEDTETKFMKQIVEQTLKAVVPFDVSKARVDGTTVKT
jgi:uncharacterized FlaG/YvyC family protein